MSLTAEAPRARALNPRGLLWFALLVASALPVF